MSKEILPEMFGVGVLSHRRFVHKGVPVTEMLLDESGNDPMVLVWMRDYFDWRGLEGRANTFVCCNVPDPPYEAGLDMIRVRIARAFDEYWELP